MDESMPLAGAAIAEPSVVPAGWAFVALLILCCLALFAAALEHKRSFSWVRDAKSLI